MTRRLAYAAIGLGLVAVLALGFLSRSDGGTASDDVRAVPTRAEYLERLEGAPVALAALHVAGGTLVQRNLPDALRQLRGFPVVVNLWASWCGPCKDEFPAFQRVSVDVGKEVAFLGVNTRDGEKSARRFLDMIGPVSFPSLEDRGAKAMTSLRALGLPATAFYDTRGKLVELHQGPYRSDADLLRDVRRYAKT